MVHKPWSQGRLFLGGVRGPGGVGWPAIIFPEKSDQRTDPRFERTPKIRNLRTSNGLHQLGGPFFGFGPIQLLMELGQIEMTVD